MAPSRFTKSSDRKREVTPFRDEPGPASLVPLRPTTPGPNRPSSPVDPNRPVTPAPPEWTSYDAPINFTWVIPDELCGMGWPKSRDQVSGARVGLTGDVCVPGEVPGGAGHRPPGESLPREDPATLCISRSQTYSHSRGGLHRTNHRGDSEVYRNH